MRMPEVGEFWVNSQDRLVEIVASDVLPGTEFDTPVEVFAYRYANGTMIHLRSEHQMSGWRKAQYE